jgi:hypothetical protein
MQLSNQPASGTGVGGTAEATIAILIKTNAIPAGVIAETNQTFTLGGMTAGFYDVTLTVTANDGFATNDAMVLAVKGPAQVCEYTKEDHAQGSLTAFPEAITVLPSLAWSPIRRAKYFRIKKLGASA